MLIIYINIKHNKVFEYINAVILIQRLAKKEELEDKSLKLEDYNEELKHMK